MFTTTLSIFYIIYIYTKLRMCNKHDNCPLIKPWKQIAGDEYKVLDRLLLGLRYPGRGRGKEHKDHWEDYKMVKGKKDGSMSRIQLPNGNGSESGGGGASSSSGGV